MAKALLNRLQEESKTPFKPAKKADLNKRGVKLIKEIPTWALLNIAQNLHDDFEAGVRGRMRLTDLRLKLIQHGYITQEDDYAQVMDKIKSVLAANGWKVGPVEEADSPFKPASKEEVKARKPLSGPKMASLEVQQAIEKVLDYAYAHEEEHWESYDEEESRRPKDHIYNSMKVLADFVGYD